MKKMLRFLMLAVLFLPFALSAQTSVMIGDTSTATDNTYLPMNSLYEYSYSQQIYTPSEIGTAGTIHSITIWMRGASDLHTMPFDIYMLEVEAGEFATTTSWIPVTASDVVYSGSVTVHNTTDSAYTFELTVPFTYSGTGNLLICFDNNSGAWKSGLNGKVFQTEDGVSRAMYVRRDGTDYNPLNMSGITATAKTSLRNVISINITPSGQFCERPSTLIPSGVTAHEATFTWNSTVGNYVFEYKAANDTLWAVTSLTDTTYSLSGLISNTQYNARVKSVCGVDFESGYKSVNFTTLISCPVPTDLAVTLNPNASTEATLSWTENGTADAWQIILNDDSTNIITANTNPFTLTNLVADSVYMAKVRAYCDMDDQSVWSNSIRVEPTTKTVIGSGNVINGYLPTYTYYNYSLTQQIYTVAELGDQGLIESIDFFNNGTESRTRDLAIYIVNTVKDTFANSEDWISATVADLQFSGSVTFAPQSWTTIPLSGFVYTGLNNIAIIVDDNSGSWVSSVPFLAFNANNQALRVYDDNVNFDVTSTDHNGSYAAVENSKNQIRIVKGALGGCLKPTGLTVNYTGGNEAQVTWYSDETSFNIDVNGTVVNNVTSPYTLTGLDLATTYAVSVQTVCDATSVSEWTSPVSFTTDACLPEDMCSITINGTDSYNDGWNGNAINIIQNGVTVGTFTLPYGTGSMTHTFNVCPGYPVSFSWVTGSYPDEADFTILDGGSAAVFSANGDDLADTVFFTMETPCPSCMPALGLTVDEATQTSITISWTGNAPSYDLYNGETFVANVTTNSYTFNNLDVNTAYTFGVQSICSATDSAVMMVIAATTSCATTAINLPFSETFDLNSPTRNCWTNVDADNDGYAWTFNEDYTGIEAGSALSYSYLNATYSAVTPDNWFISPKLHAPASSNITMEWTVQSAPSYPAEHYGVYVSTTTTDTSAFTMVNEWTITNGAQEQKVLDLSAYAGQDIYVAFRHHDCTDQYVLMIDDVEIYEGAYVPDTLTVTFAVNDATMGTTIPAPGVYSYIAGDTVYFGSQANPGHIFESWEIVRGTTTTDTFTLNSQYANGYYVLANSWMSYGNITFTANFVAGLPDSTTITYAVNDATMGTTIPAPGTYTIYVGDNMIAEAVPNDGYMLSAWRVDLYESGVHVDSLTITNDLVYFSNPINFGSVSQEYADYDVTVNITAIFEPGSAPVTDSLTINLTINNPALGTITPAPGTYTLAVGDSIVLEAFPNANVDFVGWQLSVAGQTAGTVPTSPFTLPITASAAQFGEIDIVAIFDDGTIAPDSLTVILNTADATMGTTNPAPGIHKYAVGDESVITAVPNPGYNFLYWIESASIAGMTMYDTIYAPTVSMVVPQMYANMTLSLTAYFEPIPYEPCETPTGLAVSSYDEESISLVWDNNDAVESWNVRLREQGTEDWTTEVAYENAHTFHGLAVHTAYEMQVQANCGGDNLSDWTASVVQTTLVGINSYLESNVTLYPNPAKEFVDVRIDGDVNVTAMEVYDVYGKLINTVNVIDNTTHINVSALANGMYFVRVTTEQGVVTKRFVKK